MSPAEDSRQPDIVAVLSQTLAVEADTRFAEAERPPFALPGVQDHPIHPDVDAPLHGLEERRGHLRAEAALVDGIVHRGMGHRCAVKQPHGLAIHAVMIEASPVDAADVQSSRAVDHGNIAFELPALGLVIPGIGSAAPVNRRDAQGPNHPLALGPAHGRS